jgi:hypothetical protein
MSFAALNPGRNKPCDGISMSKSMLVKWGIPPFLIGIAVGVFLFTETSFSWAMMSWHHRFERALQEKNEVRLGELVNFQWDRIYLLLPYSYLTQEQEAQLFPTSSWDFWWWQVNEGYWTIAYQRPARQPFLVRMSIKEWNLRKLTNQWTTDRDAKLRLVPSNTIEFSYCHPYLGRCLALVDARSQPITTPYN